jgi:diguanylate cyclase (GGDEF)-like protein/PAS domain S-box-containing protein
VKTLTECPHCSEGIPDDALVCPHCLRDLILPSYLHPGSEEVALEQQSSSLLANVFASTTEGILITNENGRIVMVNEAFSAVTGYELSEVLGKNPRFLRSGRQNPSFYQEMWKKLIGADHWQGEIWNRRKDGEIYLESLSISVVRNLEGKITNYVGVYTDITARKKEEERLQYLATHDPLTNLPNRILFNDRLNQALARAQRNRRLVGLLFIDLDGFKAINDNFGHEKGDRLLQTVARRLSGSIRHSDTVARVGGDEFTGLMEDLSDVQSASGVAAKILSSISRPFQVDDNQIQISASIGISIYPIDGGTAEILLRKADIALYRAKALGKNRFQFHSPWN